MDFEHCMDNDKVIYVPSSIDPQDVVAGTDLGMTAAMTQVLSPCVPQIFWKLFSLSAHNYIIGGNVSLVPGPSDIRVIGYLSLEPGPSDMLAERFLKQAQIRPKHWTLKYSI
jgi:hypothetical protein